MVERGKPPEPEDRPAAAAAEEAGEGLGERGPYRNLWVPLIVVPAGVIGVMLLVFVFFSAIAGREASPRDNLRRMVTGGTNERQQAAFSLVRQLRAAAEGRESDWEVGPAFLAEVHRAWDETDPDDLSVRLVLAHVLAQNQDPQALARLAELLDVDVDVERDPDGLVRFDALVALKRLGDPAGAALAIPFLSGEDHGLRVAAASALKAMPGEATVAALRAALKDDSIEVRGTAAISLSHLGDASGAFVLRDLAGTEIYEAVRIEQPDKFASPQNVRENRMRAIEALARLDLPQDREVLSRIAAQDADLEVREAAQRGLAEDGG